MVLNEEGTPIPQIIIELNAPDFLEFKENIYDQGPFKSVLNRTAGSSIFDKRNLARMLSYFAEKSRGLHCGNEEKLRCMRSPSFLDAILVTHCSGLKAGMRGEVKKSLEMAASDLAEYPYWYEYIVQHIKERPGQRFPDGEPSKPMLRVKDQRSIRIRSYARWVTEKILREDKVILEGLEEIFPQDLLQEPLSLPREASFKKWQILKASELVSRRNR